MSDPYHTLGLQRGASPEAVKAAYRRLALQYHPDRNPDPAAAQQFVRIKRAYEVLSNPQKYSSHSRKTYTGPSSSAPPKASADQRKYGTRHKFSNPPPTYAAQKQLYKKYLKEYTLFTKSGLRMPRDLWRGRLKELWQEIRINHRWLVALSVGMLVLSIFIAMTDERNLFAFNALLICILTAWNLLTDKAPRSLAERKAKARQK